jgi:hypothetical protein
MGKRLFQSTTDGIINCRIKNSKEIFILFFHLVNLKFGEMAFQLGKKDKVSKAAD